MRKAITFFGNILLIVGALLLIAITLTPAQLGLSLHSIISGSMEPTLNTGGIIALKTASAEEIQVEDIICFDEKENPVPICHRVIAKEVTEAGLIFHTKGDALEEPDKWTVYAEDLLGKVIFHLPLAGFIASNIRTPGGFFIAIVIPAIFILALEVIDYFKPTRARVQRTEEQRKKNLSPANNLLQIGFAVIAILWLMIAGNTQTRPLSSFPLRTTTDNTDKVTHSRTIRNDGYFPLVICMISSDTDISFQDAYFLLLSGEEKKTEIYGGDDDSIILTRGFFPTLPPTTLHKLLLWNQSLSSLVTIAIPITPFLLLGWYLLKGSSSTRAEHRARARQMKGRLI